MRDSTRNHFSASAVCLLIVLAGPSCSVLFGGDSSSQLDAGTTQDPRPTLDATLMDASDRCAVGNLRDEFDILSGQDWSVTTQQLASTTFSDGQLKVALGAGQASYAAGGLQSIRSDFSVIDRFVQVRFTQMTTTTEPVSVSMVLSSEAQPSTNYRLRQIAGMLRFERSINGGPRTLLASAEFDLVAQAVWQLRATDSDVVAEVGPSAEELTVLGSDALDSSDKRRGVERVFVLLLGESTESIGDPGEVHFDYFEHGCVEE